MLVVTVFDFNVNRLCPTCGQARGNAKVFALLLLQSLPSERLGECKVTKLLQTVPSALVPYLLVLIEAHGGKKKGPDMRKGCASQPFWGSAEHVRTDTTCCLSLVHSQEIP